MKSTKDLRAKGGSFTEDTLKKPVKLAPIKKSGKDKHFIYEGVDYDDDEIEDLTETYRKKESVFDYFDDLEEDEDIPDDELEDFLEDEWEEDRDNGDEEEFPYDYIEQEQ